MCPLVFFCQRPQEERKTRTASARARAKSVVTQESREIRANRQTTDGRTDAQKGIEVKRLLGVDDCGGDQEGSQQSQPASQGQKIERERKKGTDPMALEG